MSNEPALETVYRRYSRLAAVYDRTSGAGVLFRQARARTVDLLDLSPGATVLDLACGTGLNFPLILERIGRSGTLIGVDLTSAMLRKADSRSREAGWSNVRLVKLNAADLSRERLARKGVLPPGHQVDAGLCTLGLSVIPDWKAAWENLVELVRPGGHLAAMDGDYPTLARRESGLARPVTWFVYRLSAADPERDIWPTIERSMRDLVTAKFSWGGVKVAAGYKP